MKDIKTDTKTDTKTIVLPPTHEHRGRPRIYLSERELAPEIWKLPNEKVAERLGYGLSTVIKLRKLYRIQPLKPGRPEGT